VPNGFPGGRLGFGINPSNLFDALSMQSIIRLQNVIQ